MKRLVLVMTGIAILASAAPVMAAPGVINQACRKADRSAATPQLCSCIQRVANASLNMVERRKVAKWFSDPHKAQEVRQSDRRRDEILWERYKLFGERAKNICE